MHRPTLGVVALLFLGGGIIALYVQHEKSGGFSQGWAAAAVRIGAFFAVLWLAHPQLHRIPTNVWIGILVLAIVLSRSPKLFPIAAVFLIVILMLTVVLRPRGR